MNASFHSQRDQRIFLFKLAASGHREQLVLDSGFRCHLSSYVRTTASTPSAFVTRLRKFLRTRRVTKVAQVGTDRILELEFSDGQYHLFLEFYAGGNIVLTDQELNILALQRNVNEGAPHEQIRAGLQYNLSKRQNVGGIPPMTKERIRDGLQSFTERNAMGQQNTNKKLKKKPGDTLRKALAGFLNEYPPMLLDHALRTVKFNINLQPEDVVAQEDLLTALMSAMDVAQKLMDEIISKDIVNGYIFGKPVANSSPPDNDEAATTTGQQTSPGIMYEDFHPFKPKHLDEDPVLSTLEFQGYNRTVDEFFSSIEGQKMDSRLAEKEANAKRKIEHARQDQEKRVDGLQQVQQMNVRRAQAIEANLERVREATAAVNGLIAQGMDWDEVSKLVELEQKRHNPVADVIKLPLKLHENTVTLKLAEWGAEDDDEEMDSTDSEPSQSETEDEPAKHSTKVAKDSEQLSDKRLTVDIDLGLSAWSNARDYYDQKRSAAVKEAKTVQASARALKSTQRRVEADLKKALKQEKQALRPVRQPFWFEKFTYFMSSDGYLVLGARDAQQSDILYNKHLKKGDLWVHADLEGAMPCIIKNREVDAPIPPSTLSQAGNLCVATSTAWDSKAVMSAWWVTHDKVAKKARTGDYLQPGKFETQDEKNHLPPAQLLLGFAVLFQISGASKANHTKHRVQETNNVEDSMPEDATEDTKESGNLDKDDITTGNDEISEADEGNEDHELGEDGTHSSEYEDERESVEMEDANTPRYSNPLQMNDENSVGKDSATSHRESLLSKHTNVEQHDEAEPLSNRIEGESETPAEEATRSDSHSNAEAESRDNDQDSIDSSNVASLPNAMSRTPIPVRGKKGKMKKIAQKYADQDEEDRNMAMLALGSAAGQQRQKEEAEAKTKREQEAAAQRQRRHEQHQKALERQAQRERVNGEDEDEDEENSTNVDLDTLVGMPLPGDEILEAVPICAPWGALGRYKYKVKLQPGSEKKGKAVRSILSKWTADAANKRNVDEKSEDTERCWPKEVELIKSWKEAEIFGVVPVGKVRVMMPGALAGSGKKGASKQKQKKPSGKGSKKQR